MNIQHGFDSRALDAGDLSSEVGGCAASRFAKQGVQWMVYVLTGLLEAGCADAVCKGALFAQRGDWQQAPL
jgi:hypothetical protein